MSSPQDPGLTRGAAGPAASDRRSRYAWEPYLFAACATAGALILRWLLEPWLMGRFVFITIFGAVAVSAWVAGTWPSVLAACLGFAGSALWQREDGRFAYELDFGFFVVALTYLVSCALIVGFGAMLRRTQRRLEIEIGDRQEAERQRAEQQEHLTYTVDLNPQVTWTARPDGELDHVADRWQAWTGASGLGSGWSRSLHPDDRAHTLEAWARSLATGEAYDVEHRVRMSSGDYIWARSRAFPRRDESGGIIRWYGTTENIHERKVAEQRLRELNVTLEQQVAERTAALQASESRVRMILGSSFQYQGLLTPEGELLEANATSLAAINARLEDVVGRKVWETPWFTATPGMPEAVRAAIEAAARGESMRGETTVDLPGGSRCFDYALRPIRDDAGTVIALVPEARDITERREAEARLRQAQRIEAIGQLSGGVAHDFNNLLMVISGGLELLSRVEDRDRVQRVLGSMRQAVDRGAGLSRQLLAFSRRQELRAVPVDLRRRIGQMEELLDRSLRGDVNVRTEIADDLWPVEVDPGELELVILNLAVNSRDAMPGGGTIVIRVENAPGTKRVDLDGDFVRLSISDTGTGMAPEVLERAFEPFFTTKELGKGSGLGLAQAHGFARASGGAVDIESKPGHGTCVSLLLPRTDKRPAGGDDGPAEMPNHVVGRRSAGHVLLVEDDDEVAALTGEMIRQMGYESTRVASAEAALGALANGRTIDLVFSDVMMPGPMNGMDLARELRRRRPGLPVLLTSGYSEAIQRDVIAEDIQLLPKPYRLNDLERAFVAARRKARRDAQ